MKTHIFTLACIFTMVSGTAFSQDGVQVSDKVLPGSGDNTQNLGLTESEFIRLKALTSGKNLLARRVSQNAY